MKKVFNAVTTFGNLIIHDLRNCKNHGRESIEMVESPNNILWRIF